MTRGHFIAAICAAIISTAATADPQSRGYIQNSEGRNCTYTQVTHRGISYFHSIPGTYSLLRFDDSACMKDVELGLDVNKMMVNNVIARWYSHADAAFKTRPDQLLPTSPLQVRGQCIQSAKYPIIGVAVEYHVVGNSIVAVSHAATAGQCTH